MEKTLRSRIERMLERAKEFYKKGEQKEILLEEELKVVVIFGGNKWPTWEEVCKVKQRYWQAEEAAVQFNVGAKFDLNSKYIIILWDAENFDLLSKEFV